MRDGTITVTSTVTILVRPVGSGAGSEDGKAGPRALLSLQLQPDRSMVLKVVGPVGARYRVESTPLLGAEWQTEESIAVIETQGETEPVVVPLPSEEAGQSRQFRLRKE